MPDKVIAVTVAVGTDMYRISPVRDRGWWTHRAVRIYPDGSEVPVHLDPDQLAFQTPGGAVSAAVEELLSGGARV